MWTFPRVIVFCNGDDDFILLHTLTGPLDFKPEDTHNADPLLNQLSQIQHEMIAQELTAPFLCGDRQAGSHSWRPVAGWTWAEEADPPHGEVWRLARTST